jgi:uncharacterized protein YdeI (YjbR/CyaY-like superfamily)
MEIGLVFYPHTREEWRAWLEENHQSAPDIWLQTPHVKSGKPRIDYDSAVEEALCFGWIDGITKKYTIDSAVQRYTPRRPKSFLSELNRQRIFNLIREEKMTDAGIAPIQHLLGEEHAPLVIPQDIEVALRADVEVWKNFQSYPVVYQKVRIGFIGESLDQETSMKRLEYLIKMTKKNKMYGTVVW